MFADLDKCERIYHSKSKGFDQKRARTLIYKKSSIFYILIYRKRYIIWRSQYKRLSRFQMALLTITVEYPIYPR